MLPIFAGYYNANYSLKARKTLSNWLSERYLLIIRNEENFAEKSTISFTYAKVLLLAVLMFSIVLVLALFLSRTILAQWFDPLHAQMENNKRLFELSIKMDSLEAEMQRKDLFINTIQTVLTGNVDSVDFSTWDQPAATNVSITGGYVELSPVDSQFRQHFEAEDQGLLIYEEGASSLSELYFYTPLKGYISRKYNLPEGHFGVDIVAKKNEPVMTVADGTVLLSSWTQDSGYVIAIQHADNLISVYKHNSELLKKVGNFVQGGDVIAIVGNTGELTDGPHLHFEVWYNGDPVNPEDFVTF